MAALTAPERLGVTAWDLLASADRLRDGCAVVTVQFMFRRLEMLEIYP
jgi:hypothetical protein